MGNAISSIFPTISVNIISNKFFEKDVVEGNKLSYNSKKNKTTDLRKVANAINKVLPLIIEYHIVGQRRSEEEIKCFHNNIIKLNAKIDKHNASIDKRLNCFTVVKIILYITNILFDISAFLKIRKVDTGSLRNINNYLSQQFSTEEINFGTNSSLCVYNTVEDKLSIINYDADLPTGYTKNLSKVSCAANRIIKLMINNPIISSSLNTETADCLLTKFNSLNKKIKHHNQLIDKKLNVVVKIVLSVASIFFSLGNTFKIKEIDTRLIRKRTTFIPSKCFDKYIDFEKQALTYVPKENKLVVIEKSDNSTSNVTQLAFVVNEMMRSIIDHQIIKNSLNTAQINCLCTNLKKLNKQIKDIYVPSYKTSNIFTKAITYLVYLFRKYCLYETGKIDMIPLQDISLVKLTGKKTSIWSKLNLGTERDIENKSYKQNENEICSQIKKRRKEVRQKRDSKEIAAIIKDQENTEFYKKIIYLSQNSRSSLECSRDGQGGARKMVDSSKKCFAIVKPHPEDLCMFNNVNSGVAQPFGNNSKDQSIKARLEIPLGVGAENEALAFQVAEAIFPNSKIVPKTVLANLTNEDFNDVLDNITQMSYDILQKAGTPDRKCLCSVQEFVDNADSLYKLTESDIKKLIIDQENFEECVILDWIICNADGNSGNYLIKKGKNKIFKVDNGLIFPKNNLSGYYQPNICYISCLLLQFTENARKPLSNKMKNIILNLDQKKIIELMKKYRRSDAIKAFTERIDLFQTIIKKDENIPMEDIDILFKYYCCETKGNHQKRKNALFSSDLKSIKDIIFSKEPQSANNIRDYRDRSSIIDVG